MPELSRWVPERTIGWKLAALLEPAAVAHHPSCIPLDHQHAASLAHNRSGASLDGLSSIAHATGPPAARLAHALAKP